MGKGKVCMWIKGKMGSKQARAPVNNQSGPLFFSILGPLTCSASSPKNRSR